jgi:hypothetical protein
VTTLHLTTGPGDLTHVPARTLRLRMPALVVGPFRGTVVVELTAQLGRRRREAQCRRPASAAGQDRAGRDLDAMLRWRSGAGV